VRVWNVGAVLQSSALCGHKACIHRFAFSADGARIVTCGGELRPASLHSDRDHDPKDTIVRIWDVESERCLAMLEGHAGAVLDVAFSADATKVATGASDRTARVWDAHNGRCIATLAGHTDQVRRVSFSPDGAGVLTASKDESARLWDSDSGTQLLVLWGLGAQRDPEIKATAATVQSVEFVQSLDVPVTCARFSADGRYVVTNCGGHAIVWDAATGARISQLNRKQEAGAVSEFSPDGETLISAGGIVLEKPLDIFFSLPIATTAKIWSASTGAERLRAPYRGHTVCRLYSGWRARHHLRRRRHARVGRFVGD
jgi:WD40 repeat protein